MRYLSVCSGIEAATVAWHQLGWTPAAFAEIEKFPSQVLAHHYQGVPNLGDMTQYKGWDIGTVDLLVGGTPCQSFSVAGLRKGLADPRGNLALVYCGLLDHYRPRWFVWENVPGVLSSSGGRDFGAFLGAVAQLGYGFAYRVLDAQWFGVAQRRRRVFVVGHLGDWRPAAEILFEREGLRGDPAPSREKRKDVAGPITAGIGKGCRGTEGVESNWAVPTKWPADVASTLNAAFGSKLGLEDQHINGGAPLFVPSPVAQTYSIMPMNSGKDYKARPVEISQPLMAGGPVGGNQGGDFVVQPLAFNARQNPDYWTDCTGTLDTDGSTQAVFASADVGPTMGLSGPPYSRTGNERVETEALAIHRMAVRRLTPIECERLQGFPDGYTDIQPGGKATPDGPRYKALGNSMAVPVMAWIGRRIQKFLSGNGACTGDKRPAWGI